MSLEGTRLLLTTPKSKHIKVLRGSILTVSHDCRAYVSCGTDGVLKAHDLADFDAEETQSHHPENSDTINAFAMGSQVQLRRNKALLAPYLSCICRPKSLLLGAKTELSPCTNILAWSTRQMWHDSHFLFGVWRSPPQTSSWQQEGSKFSLRPYMDKRFCPITIVFMQRWDHSDHQRGGSHRVRSASRWEQFP